MTIFNIIITIGVGTTLGAFVYIGKKLQILDDLKNTTEKIKANVKVIGDHLTSSDKGFSHGELQAYSPLQLTDIGKKLIDEIGFDDIFKANRKDFCDFIDKHKPQLKYDVEQAAIESVKVLSDKPYMKSLKVFFYNNPERNIENTAPTLGVYLRDMYLESHPEIKE